MCGPWQYMKAFAVAALILSGCAPTPELGKPTDHDLAVAVAMVVREHCSQWSDPYTIWLKVIGAGVDDQALGDYAVRCTVTEAPNPPSGVAAVVTVSGVVVGADGSLRMDLRIRNKDVESSGWFITEHRTVFVPWHDGRWGHPTWNLMSIQPQPG